MDRYQRACQVWSVLALGAASRQIVPYDLLSKLIGVPRAGLGQLLEPIQSYCILKKLPALTSIVVSHDSGMPGEGFIAASDVPREQALVFKHNWLSANAPTEAVFKQAAERLPSNGRSLADLQKEVPP